MCVCMCVKTFNRFVRLVFYACCSSPHRPARNDVPSMYIEEDELNELEEGGGRAAEIRARITPATSHLCGAGGAAGVASGLGGVGSAGGGIVGVAGPHHYISESFIQYAQPSLNGTIPKSILNRL